MIANKIKGLLLLSNSNVSKYAEATNQTQPNVSNKIKRNTWTLLDLLKLANHTNTKIYFINEKDDKIICFDKHDLKEFEE